MIRPFLTRGSRASLCVALSCATFGAASATAPLPPSVSCAEPAECFQLNAMSIQGVTAYPQGELAPLYDSHLTREIGTAELVAIADAITARYRADGYFLSRAVVPPQEAASGVGRITVYEGFVSAVEVSGPGGPAIARYFRDLEGRRPLKLADLDGRMRLAQDAPGVVVKARLEPELDDPAAHRLVIEAGLERFDLTAHLDNRGPETAGPLQSNLAVGWNSALSPGDRLGLAVFAIPDDLEEFRYAEVNYAVPMKTGGALRGYLGVSEGGDGADPRSEQIGGESWSAGLSYFHPIRRTRDHALSGLVSLNARRIEQDWSDVGGYRDELRVGRAALTGELGPGSRATSYFLQLSAGRRGSVAGRDATLSRADADRGFWKVNAYGSHYRDLGRYAGMFVAAEGQWTPNRLLASEEFMVGGLPYGRGYNFAELSGDRGLAASAELRAGWDPKPKAISFLQGYGFVDYAQVWNRGRGSDSLASAGVGLRARLGLRGTVGVEAARPLTRTPYDQGKKGWRSLFSITLRY